MSCALCYELLRFSMFEVEERWFWIAHFGALTAYVSYFALFFCAASAQLTFASDNRSTALRICMVAQHALWAGWVAFICWEEQVHSQFIGNGWPLVMGLTMAALHWSLMGMFMTGESPNLSPRVQRTLPKTSAGRAFLTWFFPGPATGYVFVLANMAGAIVLALLAKVVWDMYTPAAPGMFRIIRLGQLAEFGVIAIGYMAFYLGLSKLILGWLRHYSVVGALTSVLVNVLLLLAGCGIPLVIHLMSDWRMTGYNLLHITNPFWTIVEVIERRGLYNPAVLLLVSVGGGIVFLLNLRSILEEMRLVRAARPTRVEEEDLALAPATVAARIPRDPWDEGE
jgi:hypothetical protein